MVYNSSPWGSPSRRLGQEGRLLAEVAVAIGIGAVVLFGLLAAVAATGRLDRHTKNASLARRAVEARLAELASLGRGDFARALAAGPDAEILAFDVPGLLPVPPAERVGRVTIDPPFGDPRFEEATLFAIRAEATWIEDGGAVAGVALEALVHPEEGE